MADTFASAGAETVARLVRGASLEVTVRDKDAGAQLRDLIAPGERINVTYLSNATYLETVTQAAALARAGFDPVPHVAARSLKTARELDDYIARCVGEAGVSRVLLVAGDLEPPRGPFSDSLAVLQTGALERHGVKCVSFALHPEGHPSVSNEIMGEAILAKLAYAESHGLESELISQFCFEAAPILAAIRDLRQRGIDTPVRIGAAAPTDAVRMMRFALRCGVGPSLRALEKNAARVAGAMSMAGPEALVGDLAAALQEHEFGAIEGMHFFVFGGVKQAARWLANWRRQFGES